MHSRCLAVFVVLALLPPFAWAETCKYLDSDGRVIYSNTPNSPPKGATKVKCFEAPSKPAPTAASPKDSDAKGRPPRVSEDIQRSRDNDRRRILEEELADETKQLAQAQEKLAAEEAVRTGNERNYERYLERLQPFRDAVATHERNLDAIKREIANLK
jgi:hypothetical protein